MFSCVGEERGASLCCVRARLMYCLSSAASGAAWGAELAGRTSGLAASTTGADGAGALDDGPLGRSRGSGGTAVAVRALFISRMDRRRLPSVEAAQTDEAAGSFLRWSRGGPDAELVSRCVVGGIRLREVTVAEAIECDVCVVCKDIAEGIVCDVCVLGAGNACVV